MNIKDSKHLGEVVRERRRQLKVTQKDLAMTCGSGLRFIIDLEKGKPTCQTGKALQILQALGLEINIGAKDTEKHGGDKA